MPKLLRKLVPRRFLFPTIGNLTSERSNRLSQDRSTRNFPIATSPEDEHFPQHPLFCQTTTDGCENEIFIGIVCRPFSLTFFRLPKSSGLRKVRNRTGRSENICTRVERERELRATQLVVCSSPLSDFACERSRDTEIHSEREKRWLKRRRAGEWGRKDEEERERESLVRRSRGTRKKRGGEWWCERSRRRGGGTTRTPWIQQRRVSNLVPRQKSTLRLDYRYSPVSRRVYMPP